MAVGLALASNTQISALSTIFVTSLLTSHHLDSLIMLNSQRLSAAYTTLTSFLKGQNIPYIPCNAGLYVFARIAGFAKTWEDEDVMVQKLKEAGVLVSSGKAYHVPETEKGWMRVGFAIEELDLREAIRRMENVLGGDQKLSASGANKLKRAIASDMLDRDPTKRTRILQQS